MNILHKLIQILPCDEEQCFWCLLGAEGVVDIQDWNHESSVALRHLLDQMLDLEELSYCDLDAVIAVDEVVVDEEHLLFL